MSFAIEWAKATDQRQRGQWMLLEALYYLEAIPDALRTRADQL